MFKTLLSNTHDSFLQDTPDFFRWLEDLNDEKIIEDDDILVTVDVRCDWSLHKYTSFRRHKSSERDT